MPLLLYNAPDRKQRVYHIIGIYLHGKLSVCTLLGIPHTCPPGPQGCRRASGPVALPTFGLASPAFRTAFWLPPRTAARALMGEARMGRRPIPTADPDGPAPCTASTAAILFLICRRSNNCERKKRLMRGGGRFRIALSPVVGAGRQ